MFRNLKELGEIYGEASSARDKPLQGRLSDDEYAILDELNGLVMAGEIALERLQKAGEARVAAGGRAC